MKKKIIALRPMLEALGVTQSVSLDECASLWGEIHRACLDTPPPFELSGNQWTAFVNLAVARFGSRATQGNE